MDTAERAKHIIRDFIAIPKDRWTHRTFGGQGVFFVEGHSGEVMYFAETLLDSQSDDPQRDDAIAQCRERLGSKRFAVEIWDESEECVCLLRWNEVDEIEVAEYEHGSWETVAFGLPPVSRAYSPTFH